MFTFKLQDRTFFFLPKQRDIALCKISKWEQNKDLTWAIESHN